MSKPRPECRVPESFDTTPFGLELAGQVADYLAARGEIAYDHRDYCGAGLFLRDGAFVYAEVYDGYPDPGGTHATFPDRTAFVEWLARQSDESLSGRDAGDRFVLGNQRITRARLEAVLATHRLVRGLARTDFVARYYDLCRRFPTGEGDRGGVTEAEVVAILAELGRMPASYHWQTEPWFCPVFRFAWQAGAWAGSAEFYLPQGESVQFWCYFERQGVRAGDQFASLARWAAEAGGLPVPESPYPQPAYRTAGDLREVLAELFALQDLASGVVAEQVA